MWLLYCCLVGVVTSFNASSGCLGCCCCFGLVSFISIKLFTIDASLRTEFSMAEYGGGIDETECEEAIMLLDDAEKSSLNKGFLTSISPVFNSNKQLLIY